ncbi:MAG TPA: gamma-butyrobetaine hydroxylase-like domain-containing protein, partial [Candidatus Methylomirabilis sp.]|nr:gamma-butyrobetaine hydroxylase-like domain-containing protein [Candidatus Methylomirabilis sp.]
NFTWSDGHDTGIYTYESLRAKCPCELCSQKRKAS